MKRTKTCPTCGNNFSYEIGKGYDRIYCGKVCYKKAHLEKRSERFKSLPKCSVDVCESKATRVGHGLCEKCYQRFRRNGNFEITKPKYRYVTRAGYIKLHKPHHPLADSNGDVFEHRVVMFDNIKNNNLKCRWCNKDLTWDKLVVDHLNENKQDNRLDNLVLSCNECNRARGALLPFIERLTSESLLLFISRVQKYHKRNHDIETVKEGDRWG